MKAPRIFLTGPPGIGKTTIVEKVLAGVRVSAGGFLTREIRDGRERKGFKIITLDGSEGLLAHVDFRSPFRVGKYGVDVHAFENVALPTLKETIAKKELVVIDELGKMELFSKRFRDQVLEVLQSDRPILGVIQERPNPFLDPIRERPDIRLMRVSKENREDLPGEVINELSAFFQNARTHAQR